MEVTSGEPVVAPAPPLISAPTAWAVGLTALVGTALMAASWYQTTLTISVERQSRWANVALVGLSVTCLAVVFAVVAARQAVAGRVWRMCSQLGERVRVTTAESVARDVDQLVAASGMVRYHRASCRMAAGKAVRLATRAEHEASGRIACGMCEP